MVSRVRHGVESAAFCVGLPRGFAGPSGQPRVPGQALCGATRNEETGGGDRMLSACRQTVLQLMSSRIWQGKAEINSRAAKQAGSLTGQSEVMRSL